MFTHPFDRMLHAAALKTKHRQVREWLLRMVFDGDLSVNGVLVPKSER